MKRLLLLSAALSPMAAHAQQSLDAYANSIMAQVQSDGDPECGMNGGGGCVPVTLAPGDVTPISGTTVTDKFGNTWGLQVNPQGESGAGNWYGNVVRNGQLLPGNDHAGGLSYAAAIRLGSDGLVYIERSKGAGWQVEPTDPAAQQNYNYNITSQWAYVTPPGSGVASVSGVANDTATAIPDVSLAAAPSSPLMAPGQSSVSNDPNSCSGSVIGPGSGSVTTAAGDFTVDTSNNEVMLNGEAATPNGEGSQTSAIMQVDGQVYGQDQNSLQWFHLVQDPSRPYWDPVGQLPQSTAQALSSALPSGTATVGALDQDVEAACQASLQTLQSAQARADALQAKMPKQ